ncbi:MAG: radical SAM protein [Myxococcota bacterium]|nr:radical SAM protein [Myxococcota bacterium]MDW8361497.1 radical SAM protein [Myxococcales bacterium]
MDVALVLTHDCNLGCGYCYAGAKFNRRMPEQVVDRALELAFADGSPEVQVSFFGGEPLLAWDALVDAARKARSMAGRRGVALRMSVTTNGTLLTQERAAVLEDLDVYVGLSIDGVRQAHEAGRPKIGGGSSFDETLRGLDVLLSRGRPFETISVVTPTNARWLGESVAFLLGRGVPRLGLNPCYEAWFDDEALARWEAGLERAADEMIDCFRRGRIVSINVFDNKILAALKGGLAPEDRCSLGTRMVAVAPSGNLYPCERLVGEDEGTRWVMGTVFDGVRVRGEACARGPVNAECDGCGERSRCTSFCACANLAETGRTDVAGGTQCWHERTTGRIADRIAATLWSERNVPFLAWFYGRLAGLPEAGATTASSESHPSPGPTGGPDARPPVRSIPRHRTDGRRHLDVLR